MARQNKKPKDWTVMVYLAGDNNLSTECVWSLKEMYRAGFDPDQVAFVVQFDPSARTVQQFDVGTDLEGVRKSREQILSEVDEKLREIYRLRFTPRVPDPTDGILGSRGHDVEVLREGKGRRKSFTEDVDQITSSTLTDFIKDSANRHPAHNYMLILSGHGSGTIGSTFLVDNFPEPRGLNMKDLRVAIEDAGVHLAILGMDACGMNMAEVGYELRDCVDYLVAAEGFEPNTGWPYHQVILALIGEEGLMEGPGPASDARQAAVNIVTAHGSYYTDYILAGISADLAACDLKKSQDLAVAIGRLAEVLHANLPKGERPGDEEFFLEDVDITKPERAVTDAVILAHWRAQSYRFEEYTDLYDFCDLLQKGCPEVHTACEDVKKVIKGKRLDDGTFDGYVIKTSRTGGAFQHSHGVSIYFPWAEFLEDEYRDLRFSSDAGWGKFLKSYVNKTRRRARPGSGKRLPVIEPRELATSVRVNPLTSTRGDILVPKVKNPPDIFFEATTEE